MSKKAKNRYVAIGSGGTGGHLFPAISIAKKLIENQYKVLFFTDDRGLKYIKQYPELLESQVFNIIILSSGNYSKIKKCFNLIRDLFKCIAIIRYRIPLCIGFGGIVSFPVIVFGILTFRKTIIHESNAVLGFANRLLLPFVNVCLTSFEETKKITKIFNKKVICVGTPIRDEIKKNIYQYDNPSVNYRFFYKINDTINLTIFAGSQATEVFDFVIPHTLGLLSNNLINKLNVIHQCRKDNIDIVMGSYLSNGITAKVKPFFENVGEIMRQSHLVIARAGASTLSELMSLCVPSILIPLPTAKDNHQLENARFLSNRNCAILLQQNTLTPERLAELLTNLFERDFLLSEMSMCCRKYSNIYADVKIISIIESILGYESKIEIKSNLLNVKYINDNIGLG